MRARQIIQESKRTVGSPSAPTAAAILAAPRRAAIAAVLCGLVMATGQAPLGLWGLALLALVAGLSVIADAPTHKRAAILGWLLGCGYFAGALFWIVEPFLVDAPRHGWMAPFALALLAAGMGLFWGAGIWLGARLAPAGPARVLAMAMGLAGAEALRSYLLTGFPWALIGHVFIGSPVMQVAAFIGPLGLTLVALGAAALPVAFRWRGLAAGVVLLAALWGGGQWRLALPDPFPAHAAVIRLVQPNATQALKWQPEYQREFFQRLLDHSGGDPRPDLVIWPETAVPYLLEDSGNLTAVIADAARGVPVALGIQRSEGPRYYNALAVLDGQGSVTHVYDKVHLAPFGEYTPFGDLLADFGIRSFAARFGGGYTAGAGFATLDLGPLGKVMPLICYEAVFPQDLRAAPERPDWIMHITNDGWFGALTGPYQHLAQARLRAVEFGLPVLRSANTGISAVIDARGRVLDSLPLNTEGHMDAILPGALPPTPYSRTGDWPAVLFIIVAMLALWFRKRRLSD